MFSNVGFVGIIPILLILVIIGSFITALFQIRDTNRKILKTLEKISLQIEEKIK